MPLNSQALKFICIRLTKVNGNNFFNLLLNEMKRQKKKIIIIEIKSTGLSFFFSLNEVVKNVFVTDQRF